MGHITKAGTLNKETFRVAMVYGISLSSFTVEGFSLDRLSKITLQDREERFGRLKEMTTF
jgi:hypothetical protein